MRRGRRHPKDLRVGDPLDFWRVESFEPGRILRLRAEMKLPGRAWLQFEVRPEGRRTHLEQTAFFEPHGLSGNLYWYSLLQLHRFIFPGLIRAIQARAEEDHTLDYTLPGLPADLPDPARAGAIAQAFLGYSRPNSGSSWRRVRSGSPRTQSVSRKPARQAFASASMASAFRLRLQKVQAAL